MGMADNSHVFPYLLLKGDTMTHKQKIAEYRAALTAQMNVADSIMEKAENDGNKSERDTWFGIHDGLEKALTLTKMLD